MKLSQFDLIRTPTGNGTKNQNKSEFKNQDFYRTGLSLDMEKRAEWVVDGRAAHLSLSGIKLIASLGSTYLYRDSLKGRP